MVLRMPHEASFSLSVPSNASMGSYKPVVQQCSRFQELLCVALKEVLKKSHPGLVLRHEGAVFVETCLEQVLSMLCPTESPPHSVNDLEEHLKKTFPHPLMEMATHWGNTKKKTQLCLPVAKLHPILQREYLLGVRDNPALTCYLCAVLECIAHDILKLSGKYVSNLGQQEVREEDITVLLSTDQVMKELLNPSKEEKSWTCSPRGHEDRSPVNAQTYEDAVKHLIHEEKSFLRDLKMIKKVFKVNMEPLREYGAVSAEELQEIFGHIEDVFETSDRFCEALEDALEVDASHGMLGVGHVFEDMLEAEEFSVFQDYAMDLLGLGDSEAKIDTISVHSTRGSICETRRCAFTVLAEIMSRPTVQRILEETVPSFVDMCTYVLPRYLIIPVFRLSYYVEFLANIRIGWGDERSDGEDAEALKQAEGILRLKVESIDKMLNMPQFRRRVQDSQIRLWSRGPRTLMISKVAEIQRAVEGWEGKDAHNRLEFLLESDVTKMSGRDRRSERHLFLFDLVLLACKLKPAKSPGGGAEYRLKEKISLTSFTLKDKEDSPDLKHAFEIASNDQPSLRLTLSARSADEKQMWLGALFTLMYQKPLEKLLDVRLKKEDLANPLRLPMPEMYPFAEPDSPNNIVFEEPRGSVPVIKGATIIKLVERLTYHEYADPAFVKTFLITFRSFTTPARLMELLFERFDIRSPVEGDLVQQSQDYNPVLSERRFEKEFKQPVQFRVLNVMRHWVDHHFLDFESDPFLLDKMRRFLSEHANIENQRRSIKRWISSILKMMERKERRSDGVRETTFATPFPDVGWHLWSNLNCNYEIELMTLHPREVARQLTLIEFELYRAIKPSELVQWNSKDQPDERQLLAPNLLRNIQFTNKITDFFVKSIVTTENIDERVAVMSRLVDIMRELEKLNNFSGVMEVEAAFQSASVHRLEKSRELLETKYGSNGRFLDEMKETCVGNEHGSRYLAKLRRANPPCVPYVGLYLTHLYFNEKGNKEYLNENQLPAAVEQRLINFAQRRRIAEIVKEIQQYQNQPYCLRGEPQIKDFFRSVDPYDGMDKKSFEDFLWNESQKIEPKGCTIAPHFEKKYKYSLKSPLNRPPHLMAKSALGAATSMSSINSFLTSPGILRRFSQDNGLHSPTGSGGSTPISPIAESLSPSDTASPGSALPYTKDSPLLPLHSPSGSTLKSSHSSATLSSLLPEDSAPPLPPRAPKLHIEDASSPLGVSTNCAKPPSSATSYSSDGQPSSFPFDDLPPPALPPKMRHNNSGTTSTKASVKSLSFSMEAEPASNGGTLNGGYTDDLESPPPLPPRKNRPVS